MKDDADDKIKVTQKLNFVLVTVENIVGKGENAVYQYFLLSLYCCQKLSVSWSLKVGIMGYRVYHCFCPVCDLFVSEVRSK